MVKNGVFWEHVFVIRYTVEVRFTEVNSSFPEPLFMTMPCISDQLPRQHEWLQGIDDLFVEPEGLIDPLSSRGDRYYSFPESLQVVRVVHDVTCGLRSMTLGEQMTRANVVVELPYPGDSMMVRIAKDEWAPWHVHGLPWEVQYGSEGIDIGESLSES